MRNFRNGLIVAAALLAASSINAKANSYDFSYTFSDNGAAGGCTSRDGYVIQGSFLGTPSGSNDVIDISDVNAELLNASHLVLISSLGTISVYSYIGPPNQGGPSNYRLGGAIASFDGLDNNFVFGNNADITKLTSYFYIIQKWFNSGPGSTSIATQFASPSIGIDAYNGQYFSTSWSLTQTPLPSTWTMLIAGFVGLGFFAYRGTRKSAAALAAA
jgi:hypothetical protein